MGRLLTQKNKKNISCPWRSGIFTHIDHLQEETMYRKSLTIIVLFALTIVNAGSIGKPISDPSGVLKAKVARGEALTSTEE
ncbi:uncharacterized protein METZ01_LOCUS315969, partial [marine metagenome]